MSIQATDYALSVASTVPHGAQSVMFALAARTNARTGTWHTGEWIGADLGMHAGTVRRHLATLERCGVLRLTKRRGRPSVVVWPFTPSISAAVVPDATGCPHPLVARSVDGYCGRCGNPVIAVAI